MYVHKNQGLSRLYVLSLSVFGAKQYHPILQSSQIESYYVNFYVAINVGVSLWREYSSATLLNRNEVRIHSDNLVFLCL